MPFEVGDILRRDGSDPAWAPEGALAVVVAGRKPETRKVIFLTGKADSQAREPVWGSMRLATDLTDEEEEALVMRHNLGLDR